MIQETPKLTFQYCPACEPDVDPTRELAIVKWCYKHVPSEHGSADSAMKNLIGDAPVDRISVIPETQRAWADFLRGARGR